MKEKLMPFILTGKNKPAIWERGGLLEDTGAAVVIADCNGGRKTTIFIPNNPETCSNHALMYLCNNDIVVTAKNEKDIFSINVYRVQKIDIHTRLATLMNIATFCNNKWDDEIVANTYKDVITAAIQKSRERYCQEPIFCKSTF